MSSGPATSQEVGPAEIQERVKELLRVDPRSVSLSEFLGAQFDAGLAFVDHPVGYGGLGAARSLQALVDQDLRDAGAKSALGANPLAVGLGIPTLRKHGTEAQWSRYYRRAFVGEDIWCQLFSEPSAGSDLASLGTRAVRDGDHWIVNGQKVWTSLAHVASVGMLLARTDPDVPKHQGITYFLVDLHSPGIEVRPLVQMTGEAEFNEVFLTDVVVSDSDRVGPEGSGWNAAKTTLTSERLIHSGEGAGSGSVGGSRVDKLIASADGVSGHQRDELVRRFTEGRIIRWTNGRAAAARRLGRPGPDPTVTKLMQTSYNRRLQETAIGLRSTQATAWRTDDMAMPGLVKGFLRAQANTIEGGTSDVLRSIVGERVLGLPREPSLPNDTPWSATPRNV